jgi:flagellar assembly protein FliH
MSSRATLAGFDTGKFVPEEVCAPLDSRPKAPQSAWERWEMTSFNQALAPAATAKAAPEPVLAPLEPVLLIDAAELARLQLEAQKTGEAEGYEKGYARGQTEGHAAGLAAAQAQAAQLHALTLALPAALQLAQASVADDLVALALAIARQVLGQALAADPLAILAVVHELLLAEPALSGAPQLLMHPDDAALVKEHLADDLKSAGWRLRADAHVTRGGCRVLATSGERDATLETRWERVAATLGRSETPATPVEPGAA